MADPGILQEKGMTPVKLEEIRAFLSRYPDQAAAQLLEAGFADGFVILCSLARIPPMADNLRSTRMRPDVVSDKLGKTVTLGCTVGPF